MENYLQESVGVLRQFWLQPFEAMRICIGWECVSVAKREQLTIGPNSRKVHKVGDSADRKEEKILVDKAKRDPEAFGRLYELHYSAILNYFARRTLNVALAEELTSEVFYKAMKMRLSFSNQVPFR